MKQIKQSKATQRMLVALDALQQITLNPTMIIPTAGVEIGGELQKYMAAIYSHYHLPAKEFLEENIGSVPCEVCAKGALTIAHVMRFNTLKIGDLGNDAIRHSNQLPEFSPQMMDEIEFLFEGSIYGQLSDLGNDEKAKAELHYYRQTNLCGMNDRERLIRILALLVANQGTHLVLKSKRDENGKFQKQRSKNRIKYRK